MFFIYIRFLGWKRQYVDIFPILTLFPTVAWPEHPGTASEKSKNKNVVQNAQYET